MKTKITYPSLLLLCALSILSSCKKDATTTSKSTTLSTTSISARVADGSIVLASEDTPATGKKDTLFLVNCFPPHRQQPDSVAFGALPSAISTYLSANYSGYTFKKAFALDSAKTLTGYIVVIKYDNNFVGLKFTASGAFVRVLEQMLGQDMNSPQGCHPGGPFSDRGQPGGDTIALSALPSAVLAYFDKAYPSDTLQHASVTPDTTYILISVNKGLYATNITAGGTLISRMQIMPPMPGRPKPLAQSALPGTITTYLTTTYPGYVFNQAFADMNGSIVVGYDVFITANSTNYLVHFDASGNFVSATTLH